MNSLVIGRRDSGKTNFVKHLCGKMGSPVIVFCNDFRVGKEYSDLTNNIYLYREKDVDKFLDGRYSLSREITIVFSDTVTSVKDFFKSKLCRHLFLNNRQYRLNLVFELQYCVDMKPELRANTDQVWATRDMNSNNINRLAKYFDVKPSDERFVFTNQVGEAIKAVFPVKPALSDPIPYDGVRFVYAPR